MYIEGPKSQHQETGASKTVAEGPEEYKGKSRKELKRELQRIALKLAKAPAGTPKETELRKRKNLLEAAIKSLWSEQRKPQEDQEEVRAAIAEAVESPEIKLRDRIFAILQSEEPERELVERILKGELEMEAYQPLTRLMERLRDVFDFNERVKIFSELTAEETIPLHIKQGVLAAFLKDERRTRDFLAQYAEKEYKKAAAIHGERIPHETLASAKDKIFQGFAAEAEKLRLEYEGQGKSIPDAEIQNLRGTFQSLPKPLRDSVRGELGSLALSLVEVEKEDKEKPLEDIFGVARILEGEEQEKTMRSAYGLYRILYGHYKEKGTKIFKKRPPSGAPPFHISALQELLSRAWEYEAENPDLVAANKEFYRNLNGVEDFLLTRGYRELKQIIGKRRRERGEYEVIRRERRNIFDINKEVIRALAEGDKDTIEALQSLIEQRRVALKHSVEKLVQSPDAAYDFEGVAEIVRAAPEIEKMRTEAEALEKKGTGFLMERLYIEPGAEHLYTFEAFNKLIGSRRVELERRFAETPDPDQKREIARKILAVKIAEDSQDTVDYSLRLQLVFAEGIISEKELHGFLNFIEVTAIAVEMKARGFEAEAVNLQARNTSGMNDGQLRKHEDDIAINLREAGKFNDFAKWIRQGKREALPMLRT